MAFSMAIFDYRLYWFLDAADYFFFIFSSSSIAGGERLLFATLIFSRHIFDDISSRKAISLLDWFSLLWLRRFYVCSSFAVLYWSLFIFLSLDFSLISLMPFSFLRYCRFFDDALLDWFFFDFQISMPPPALLSAVGFMWDIIFDASQFRFLVGFDFRWYFAASFDWLLFWLRFFSLRLLGYFQPLISALM